MRRQTALLCALLAVIVGAPCRRAPSFPLDLLDKAARDRLVEAQVAGRDRAWVDSQAGKPIRIDDEVRRTLPAAAPSRLRFRVDVPKGARFSFAYGLDHDHDKPAPEFVVKAGEGGHEEVLFSAQPDPVNKPKDRSWRLENVELAKFAGRTIDLVLETHGSSGEDVRREYWGNPAITVANDEPPLAIVYLVDTLRADHTTVYGYERNTTPQLKAFSEDAVVFDAAISHASWTKPSVASMFTSLLPGQHRTVQLRDAMSDGQTTMAEMLQAKGVATGAAVANWIIYWQGSNMGQGFDFFKGIYGENHRPNKHVLASRVVDAGLSWLDARRGFPTFLYMHTIDPHVPYTPPAPFDQMFPPHPAPGHPGVDPRTDFLEPLDKDRMIAQYDGDIAYGDQEFGRFVRELKKRGIYDRALIVFMADHGEEFLDHGQWLHGRSVFDELIHVPMIVKFPHQKGAGRRIAQQVRSVDVLPTVLQSMGLPVPAPPAIAGIPMQNVVKGGAPEPPAISEISHRGIVAHSMRTAKDKYIQRFNPEEDELYFDLTKDPHETQNLIAGHAERARSMRQGVEAAMVSNPFRHTVRVLGTDTWDLEFRTRGWIEGVEAVGLGTNERYQIEGNGRALTVHVAAKTGPAREIAFSVRPAGARVFVTGTKNGKPLAPGDVFMAEDGMHPGAVPFPFPEIEEAENEESATERTSKVLEAPKTTAPGLQLWLKLAPGKKIDDIANDNREILKSMGYLGN